MCVISPLNYVALYASISKDEPWHLVSSEGEVGILLLQKFHCSAFMPPSWLFYCLQQKGAFEIQPLLERNRFSESC